MRRTRHEYGLSIWSHIAALTAFLMCGALLSAQDLATASHEKLLVPSREGRYITLEQAQQVASQANTLMARLGELEVETARQVRLATRADYFPQIGTIFTNLHFNKFMGPEFALRPRALGGATIGIPLIGQDQTFIANRVVGAREQEGTTITLLRHKNLRASLHSGDARSDHVRARVLDYSLGLLPPLLI